MILKISSLTDKNRVFKGSYATGPNTVETVLDFVKQQTETFMTESKIFRARPGEYFIKGINISFVGTPINIANLRNQEGEWKWVFYTDDYSKYLLCDKNLRNLINEALKRG